MKKYVFLAFFALIAFVVKAQDESGDLVKEGQQMPAFTIMNDNGTQVPSSSLKSPQTSARYFLSIVRSKNSFARVAIALSVLAMTINPEVFLSIR